ncbi:MAG: cupredoxin domain-containing protein [Bacteroidota bacterium]
MKNNRISILFLLTIALLWSVASNAQEPQKISLVQTPGEFVQQELKLEAGKSYVFEVENSGVDREVGFVVAPKGKTDQANHVQNAYLLKTIADGEKASSKTVVLEKGEYVYFCPLNPTPQYKITVE